MRSGTAGTRRGRYWWLHPNDEQECLSVPRADARRTGRLEPMTPHDDISVALQFCSKRPVPNLTLTGADPAKCASSPVPPKHPPGRGAARAAERWSEQYAERDSRGFRHQSARRLAIWPRLNPNWNRSSAIGTDGRESWNGIGVATGRLAPRNRDLPVLPDRTTGTESPSGTAAGISPQGKRARSPG